MSKHSKVTAKLKKRAACSMNLTKSNNVLKEANSMENPEDKNKNEIANVSPSELDKELAFKKDNFEDRRVSCYFFKQYICIMFFKIIS